MGSWEYVLEMVTQKSNLVTPAKRLCTLDGRLIHAVTEIQDGGKYVALEGSKGFQKVSYCAVQEKKSPSKYGVNLKMHSYIHCVHVQELELYMYMYIYCYLIQFLFNRLGLHLQSPNPYPSSENSPLVQEQLNNRSQWRASPHLLRGYWRRGRVGHLLDARIRRVGREPLKTTEL